MVQYEIHYDWASIEVKYDFESAMRFFSDQLLKELTEDEVEISHVTLYEAYDDEDEFARKELIAAGQRRVNYNG